MLSLPAVGGGFPVCDYVSPELAAFGRAEPSALEDPIIAELSAAARQPELEGSVLGPSPEEWRKEAAIRRQARRAAASA